MVKGPRGVNREGCRPKVHFDPQRLKARKGTRTREIVVQKEEEEQHQEALTELIWYQIDVALRGLPQNDRQDTSDDWLEED